MKRHGRLPALVLVLACAAAPLRADAELLPPTGPHAIGRVTFEWRELRVHVFYPARRDASAKEAPYHPDLRLYEQYTDQNVKAGYLREDFGDSYDELTQLRGHALAGAPAAASPAKFPVVVFSHGGGIQVLFYSALLEDLASHGYIVAAVEHPYDADYVFLSNGRVIRQKEWEHDAKRNARDRAVFHRHRQEADARDNSFVLDRLARINRGSIESPLRGRLDLTRASAVGHSLGGKASVVSCGTDVRWHSCVNLDGGLDLGQQYPATRKPVLAIFGGPSPVQLPIETEENFRQRSARRGEFLDSKTHQQTVAQYAKVERATIVYVISPGFSHFSYYDLLRPEAEQWGGTAERHRRNLEIIRQCVLAFLDTNGVEALRRLDAQLLIAPTRP